jgi:hypothetical protein
MSLHWSEEQWLTYQRQRGLSPTEAPAVSEKAFMAAVMRVARQHGWQCFHPYDSRKSARGYPDLTLARLPGHDRPGEVIWSELKADAPLTIEQEVWLATLSHVTQTEAYLWRPEDMPAIVARLQR